MTSTAKQSTSRGYKITNPPGLKLSKESLLDLYYFMKLNRRVEERLGILYKQNRIVGGLYSSLGQEATSVGSAYALEEGDYLAPMIRNLGSLMTRGLRPADVFLQYLARATGPTGGKDGTLHIGSLEKRLIAPVSLLGDLIPVMAGIALALKNRGAGNVALTYIGDGGTSTGAFHEGLNFAAVRKLPLILMVENNLYAYSTPVEMQANVKDLAVRAEAYGIEGVIVDGNNVLEVYHAVRRAREACLAGEGPALIESKTFRRLGHAAHDDAGYVPAELKREWERKDPLEAYTEYLLEEAAVDTKDLNSIDAGVDEEIEEAVEEAMAAPFPKGREVLEGVYYDG